MVMASFKTSENDLSCIFFLLKTDIAGKLGNGLNTTPEFSWIFLLNIWASIFCSKHTQLEASSHTFFSKSAHRILWKILSSILHFLRCNKFWSLKYGAKVHRIGLFEPQCSWSKTCFGVWKSDNSDNPEQMEQLGLLVFMIILRNGELCFAAGS